MTQSPDRIQVGFNIHTLDVIKEIASKSGHKKARVCSELIEEALRARGSLPHSPLNPRDTDELIDQKDEPNLEARVDELEQLVHQLSRKVKYLSNLVF